MATNETTAPVELADAMHAGFKDAMTRIEEVALDQKATLVDQIPLEIWSTWDATNECANVIDTTVDGFEDDGEQVPAAA